MISDVEIRHFLQSGDLVLVDPDGYPVVNPATGEERDSGQLQAHGYDLRANRVYSFTEKKWIELSCLPEYTIAPDECVIVGSYERIKLSKKVGATVHSMARKTLLGLTLLGSTTVHPGWGENEPEPAYLVVAVKNVSPFPSAIEFKERFCRLIFSAMDALPSLSAPRLDEVRRDFEKMEMRLTTYTGKKARLKGAVILVVMVAVASAVLYWVASSAPDFSAPGTALVAVLLTTGLNWVRKNYHVF